MAFEILDDLVEIEIESERALAMYDWKTTLNIALKSIGMKPRGSDEEN